ncbi:hypothetical protein ACN6K9_002558 [Streptomyces sp. SAS_267]|uniref:hypothetical protein n=1 Tax=unclassified Streptomyces TaxID=2593676 RepID=UPI0036F9803F
MGISISHDPVQILLGILCLALNIGCSIAASRIARSKGADHRDWSYVALIFGPLAVVSLLLFGGRKKNKKVYPWEQ